MSAKEWAQGMILVLVLAGVLGYGVRVWRADNRRSVLDEINGE